MSNEVITGQLFLVLILDVLFLGDTLGSISNGLLSPSLLIQRLQQLLSDCCCLFPWGLILSCQVNELYSYSLLGHGVLAYVELGSLTCQESFESLG